MSKSNIIFGLTGSIACYKACNLISKLVHNNYDVQCLATESALKFVGNATLEGLTNRPVLSGMFEKRHHKDHVTLADWADLILLCPATANTINRLRAGIAENLIEGLFLGNNFKKPYWIAPAMNDNMLAHPATCESLKTLQEWGCYIFDTEEGELACGTIGKGRLIDPMIIFEKIKREFQ